MKKDKKSKNCFDAEAEFKKLYEKAMKLGLSGEDFERMDALQRLRSDQSLGDRTETVLLTLAGAVCFICLLITCVGLIYLVQWPVSNDTLLNFWFHVHGAEVDEEPCVVDMPGFVSDIFRPPVSCKMCQNLTRVEYVSNITQEEFEEQFAYSGVPVIIEDGMKDWTAPKYFSFDFFKELYKEGSTALENVKKRCQFFPYKTSFVDLGEVFQMSKERANMEDGSDPWYIGWSNCDFTAANVLRTHYRRPYFLPASSESSTQDWIFMGSPGYGAHLHIDNVEYPSWQAQVTGTKKWTLEPPPECYYTCKDRLEVTVHQGQIIVLDTNIWYHSTLNVGNDISITIGSEFD